MLNGLKAKCAPLPGKLSPEADQAIAALLAKAEESKTAHEKTKAQANKEGEQKKIDEELQKFWDRYESLVKEKNSRWPRGGVKRGRGLSRNRRANS